MELPAHFVLVFFLILARTAGTVTMMPVMGRKDLSNMFKLALIIWITIALFGVVPMPTSIAPRLGGFLVLFVTEYLIGFIIGMITSIILIAIEFAGNIMDNQAGLSVASILDPSTGRNVPILSTLFNWIALVLFLQLDGHHFVFTSMSQSFHLLPIGQPVDLYKGSFAIVEMGIQIFEIGMLLSMPIVLVVFLLDLGFGLLNKIAEQVNVFQLSFQLKPTVSLLILLAIAPSIVDQVMKIYEEIIGALYDVLLIMQG